MNYLKENPVGVDRPIAAIQSKLYKFFDSTKKDGYGRIDSLRIGGLVEPYQYLGIGDYKEVLTDDKLDVSFFFVENPETQINGPSIISNVDVVFQLNLQKLMPSITHRADEEMRVFLYDFFSVFDYFIITEIIKGIDALKGFDTDLKDMQPYHYLRIKGKIFYELNNKGRYC